MDPQSYDREDGTGIALTLNSGTRLGPYQIEAPLGAGGMGEVYRARDTRLDRTVAVKILRVHIASRDDARQRFEREARAISSLNHPNICALYDVGHQDEIDFLVMEYLEGETLAAMLSKGRLGMDQVLRYAIQIAAGLDWAHRHGIVHRDLKPANVIVSKHGVKLLDFGLAKLAQASASAGEMILAATQTELTSQGTILGTVQYMAPEQLEGQPADARSDIFSFGAVLYEMATGRKAFEGKSQASLIAAIMRSVPPPLPQPGPARLDRVVSKCLAKDPDRRWQTAADLRDELEWIAEHPSQPVSSAPRPRWLLMSLGALAVAALFIAAALLRPRQPVPRRNSIRFMVQPPENTWWEAAITNTPFAVSPEGGVLAFVASTLDQTHIWIRPLNSLKAQILPGTEGVYSLFWANDSRSVLFYADRKLKKVSISGGPPQIICDMPGAVWKGVNMPNGDLLVNTGSATYRVTGGHATAIPNKLFLWPELLPDGDHVLSRRRQSRAVWVDSLQSGQSTPLMDSDSRVEYAPPIEAGQPGYLLYVNNDRLIAHPFNAANLRTAGERIALDQGIPFFEPSSAAMFSVSRDGVLVYHTGETPSYLSWVDRTGKELQTISAPTDLFGNMRLSPDNTKVAVSHRTLTTGGSDIWIYEVARRAANRFTFEPGVEAQPIWSPDGNRVVFGSAQKQAPKLFWKDIGETRSGEAVAPGFFQLPTDWSRDGRFILFQTSGEANSEVWIVPVASPANGGRKPLPLIQTQFSNSAGMFSGDSKWVAFVSDESGRPEVYVQAFHADPEPGVSGERHRISSNGAVMPRWRSDGKELFYIATDNRLMAVSIRTEPDFSASEPRALFRLPSPLPLVPGSGAGYDASSDGQHFVVSVTDPSKQPPLIEVVNWQEGLPSVARER